MTAQKKADLHVHTNFSDSTFTPQEVLEHARRAGLSCIAICDHDVIDGIAPALEAAAGYGIEVIPGIELTAEKFGNEIHMLGYFIDWQDSAFRERLTQLCAQREKRIYEMVEKLKGFGIDIDPAEVFKISGMGSTGRLHLAAALYERHHTRSIEEAFRKYIGNGKPCYVSKINLSPEDAIAEIIRVGGIPVLAHPGVMGKDEFIPLYVKSGLMGIEVYHTDHSPVLVKRYEKIARDFGLLVTGGSDDHGMGKGRVLMGGITVSYDLVEKLKDASPKR